MAAEIGQKAPDFKLIDPQNNPVELKDVLGEKTLIVFIPFPFSPVCEAELCQIRDDLGSLSSLDASVVVITPAHRHTNRVWTEQQGFDFPILSDYWPHGAVAKEYGCFNEANGSPWRWTFVLDKDGVVRDIVKSDEVPKPREYEAYKTALAAI